MLGRSNLSIASQLQNMFPCHVNACLFPEEPPAISCNPVHSLLGFHRIPSPTLEASTDTETKKTCISIYVSQHPDTKILNSSAAFRSHSKFPPGGREWFFFAQEMESL